MEKTINTIKSSFLYRKIDGLGLPEAQRSKALAALESADRIADAIYWVAEKAGRITHGFASNPKPKIKHQLKHQ